MLSFCTVFSSSVYALSENQKNIISQYCASMVQGFKTLQHVDVDNRVKLGSRYETAISKFMTPLNLRIVKNNLFVPELVDLQKTFADRRASFNNNFTVYSKHLKELISIDCQNYPEDFYNKLVETRKAREYVHQDVVYLNSILRIYKETVEKVKKEL
jgi:hypothetical protein